MIVRVDVLVGTQPTAQDLIGAVGENLVHVHVERDARSRVEDIDNELIQVLTGQDLVAPGEDRFASLCVESAGLRVRERRRSLDAHECPNERGICPESTDRVVLDRPLGLRAPQRAGRNFDLAQRVSLATRAQLENVQ